MQVKYYLSNMPEHLVEKHKVLLNEIYDGMIDEFTNVNPSENPDFYSGSILLTSDVFDLDPYTQPLSDNLDSFIDLYMLLVSKNVVLQFEKSAQCNSEYIHNLWNVTKNPNTDDYRYLVKLTMENYQLSMKLNSLQRRKHLFIARSNGVPAGHKKGDKIITKKSVDMKAKIKAMSRHFDGTMNDEDVINQLGLSRNTYFKYKKELKVFQNKLLARKG